MERLDVGRCGQVWDETHPLSLSLGAFGRDRERFERVEDSEARRVVINVFAAKDREQQLLVHLGIGIRDNAMVDELRCDVEGGVLRAVSATSRACASAVW